MGERMNHAPLPFPIYVNVNNTLLGLNEGGVTRALWHGIHSRPGQVVMCHLMLETGAHWSGMPLHGVSATTFFMEPGEVCPWGAMGDRLTVTAMPYLEGLEVKCDKQVGQHTGILVDWMDGWGKVPAEHKPLNLIETHEGPYLLVENNKCRFYDSHFIDDKVNVNEIGYKRGTQTYWRG